MNHRTLRARALARTDVRKEFERLKHEFEFLDQAYLRLLARPERRGAGGREGGPGSQHDQDDGAVRAQRTGEQQGDCGPTQRLVTIRSQH